VVAAVAAVVLHVAILSKVNHQVSRLITTRTKSLRHGVRRKAVQEMFCPRFLDVRSVPLRRALRQPSADRHMCAEDARSKSHAPQNKGAWRTDLMCASRSFLRIGTRRRAETIQWKSYRCATLRRSFLFVRCLQWHRDRNPRKMVDMCPKVFPWAAVPLHPSARSDIARGAV
jgi:hypothetical protein